jgi:hypothetical protein
MDRGPWALEDGELWIAGRRTVDLKPQAVEL